MAIRITKNNNQYGMDLEYWKIGAVKVDWHDSKCRIELLGFVNKAQRDAGKEAAAVVVFLFNGKDFDFSHDSGIVAQVYAKIKVHADWSDGVDVLE